MARRASGGRSGSGKGGSGGPGGGSVGGGQRQLRQRVKTARGRKLSSTRWLDRQLNDPYVVAAKARGYRSRAAFKLIELDDRLAFLKPGARVIDLGAAPGGWAQVAAERVKSVEERGQVIATDDPEPLADRIRNAGALFLGHYTPEAIGDYVAGPNHVLPTARSARFSSGLGVLDFLKRTSILKLDRGALDALAPSAMTLARSEGLEGHRRSVEIRLTGSSRANGTGNAN